jgi:hypothetical protein
MKTSSRPELSKKVSRGRRQRRTTLIKKMELALHDAAVVENNWSQSEAYQVLVKSVRALIAELETDHKLRSKP